MRRGIAAVAVACSLLWAVSGGSVLAVALHEHVHHGELHDHHEALLAALHGHAHEGSPDHDHDLSAPLSASRASAGPQLQAMAYHVPLSGGSEVRSVRAAAYAVSKSRDHGPPSYLMHCVLLT